MQEEVTILRRKAMRWRRRGEHQPVGRDEGGSRCKAVRWCRHGDIGWKRRCAILSPPHDGVMWGVKRWGGGWEQTKERGKKDFIWPCRLSLSFTVSILFFLFYASQRDSIILNVMSFKTKSKLETIKRLQLSNLGSWLSHGSLSWYSKAQKARIWTHT